MNPVGWYSPQSRSGAWQRSQRTTSGQIYLQGATLVSKQEEALLPGPTDPWALRSKHNGRWEGDYSLMELVRVPYTKILIRFTSMKTSGGSVDLGNGVNSHTCTLHMIYTWCNNGISSLLMFRPVGLNCLLSPWKTDRKEKHCWHHNPVQRCDVTSPCGGVLVAGEYQCIWVVVD